LIYGHGQQRRAIIEAVRLLETGKNKQNQEADRLDEELNGINSPQYFKDKSKKWQKFVVQVSDSIACLTLCCFLIACKLCFLFQAR